VFGVVVCRRFRFYGGGGGWCELRCSSVVWEAFLGLGGGGGGLVGGLRRGRVGGVCVVGCTPGRTHRLLTSAQPTAVPAGSIDPKKKKKQNKKVSRISGVESRVMEGREASHTCRGTTTNGNYNYWQKKGIKPPTQRSGKMIRKISRGKGKLKCQCPSLPN